MKLRNTRQSVRIGALFLSLVLFSLSVFPAYATKTVDKLEDKTSGLESELSVLKRDLKTLDKELNQYFAVLTTCI